MAVVARCQQTVSNRASRSPATHFRAIEASVVYLRRSEVEAGRTRGWERGAKSSHGRGHRFETCHAHQDEPVPEQASSSAPLGLPWVGSLGVNLLDNVA